MLETLRFCNSSLDIRHIGEESFKKYGRVVDDFPQDVLLSHAENLAIPEKGNIYVPAEQQLEQHQEIKSLIERKYFGCMSVQIGYCNGNNSNLGGLEFHKGSEFNIAATDMVLLVGHLNDIKDKVFSTELLEAFYVPKDTALEMYQTTLHLAPCKVWPAGFKCIVILPQGTNTPLGNEEKRDDPLLFMRNKWLLAHKEHRRFVEQGAHIGIKGPNVFVQYLNSKKVGGEKA